MMDAVRLANRYEGMLGLCYGDRRKVRAAASTAEAGGEDGETMSSHQEDVLANAVYQRIMNELDQRRKVYQT